MTDQAISKDDPIWPFLEEVAKEYLAGHLNEKGNEDLKSHCMSFGADAVKMYQDCAAEALRRYFIIKEPDKKGG
jgi:hypothetical protein